MVKTEETVKKKARQQQQKRLKRFQEKTRKSEDSSRRGDVHPKRKNNDWKSWANASKNVSETKEEWKDDKESKKISKTSKVSAASQESNPQKKKVLITQIKNERGEIITSCKGIAKVFGEFYKKLYDDNEQDEYGNGSNIDVHISDTEETTRIPEITSEELHEAIRKLKKGKSPDSDGIRAEDIKVCDEETKEMVRQIFNEIIRQNESTLETWKKVKIKVLHKKGDVENVGNYRPICSLLTLYKLFSTILYGRLYPRITWPRTSGRSGWIQSEAHARQRTTLRRTEWLNRNAMREESKCG